MLAFALVLLSAAPAEERCIAALERVDRGEALTHCAVAQAGAPTPENLVLYANALLLPKEGGDDRREVEVALYVATKAEKEMPDNIGVVQTVCDAAQRLDDRDVMRRCAVRLAAVGADPAEIEPFTRVMFAEPAFETRSGWQPPPPPWEDEPRRRKRAGLGTWIFRGVIAWFGVLVALFVAGSILSALALRAARNPATVSSEPSIGERLLRRIYRGVLWLACVYYYATMPLLLLGVVGGGVWLVYEIGGITAVPVRLGVLLAFAMFATVVGVWRALTVRPRFGEPGVRIDPDAHPRLKAVLREVALRVGTPPVSAVFLTPGTDIAVTEPPARALGRRRERWLILGVAALRGFPMRPFKAVLAHEYGHFANEDTAAGGFAHSVRASLGALAKALAESGGAGLHSPAWIFLAGFLRVFLRISHGATRLQEVLADRCAATAYGAAPFEQGLSLAIERAVVWPEAVQVAAILAQKHGQTVPNIFAVADMPAGRTSDVNDAMHRAPSEYDSHPPPADRIAWVRALGARGAAPAADDTADAWELFDGREDLECAVTDKLRVQLALAGIVLKSGPRTVVLDRPSRTSRAL